MNPSETKSRESLLEAARLVEGATKLIELHGWWNGQDLDHYDDVPPEYRNHCACTSLDAASCFFDTPTYQAAMAAVYNTIPESFRLTYGSYDQYTVITLYNDDHDKETILALMRRAAERLKGESEDVSA